MCATAVLLLAVALSPASALFDQTPPFGVTRCDAQPAETLGTIRLPQSVLADGKVLPAGTYQLKLTTELPAPATGQTPTAACWVQFVAKDVVAGREVATIIPADQIDAVAKGPAPKVGAARVDVLKEGEYIRAWINRDGTHYIINLPVVREGRP